MLHFFFNDIEVVMFSHQLLLYYKRAVKNQVLLKTRTFIQFKYNKIKNTKLDKDNYIYLFQQKIVSKSVVYISYVGRLRGDI